MDNQFTDDQAQQLIGGGACSLHYHDENVTHQTIERLQAQMSVVQTAVDYVATNKNDIIVADTTNNDVYVDLPPASGGKEFILCKAAANHALIIRLSGTDKVFGNGTITVYNQGESRRLKSIPGGFITL